MKENKNKSNIQFIVACGCDSHGRKTNICNKHGICECKEGYAGPRCDECFPGYRKSGSSCVGNQRYDLKINKNKSNTQLILACNCVFPGSMSSSCNSNGYCPCKEGYTGKRCDQCKSGYKKTGLTCTKSKHTI